MEKKIGMGTIKKAITKNQIKIKNKKIKNKIKNKNSD